MALIFEWDPAKADENFKKHAVTFNEAASVFGDPLSVTFYDPDHSMNEHRFITIGASNRGRPIMIAHTERGDSIRIISARTATRHERRFYEEA